MLSAYVSLPTFIHCADCSYFLNIKYITTCVIRWCGIRKVARVLNLDKNRHKYIMRNSPTPTGILFDHTAGDWRGFLMQVSMFGQTGWERGERLRE